MSMEVKTEMNLRDVFIDKYVYLEEMIDKETNEIVQGKKTLGSASYYVGTFESIARTCSKLLRQMMLQLKDDSNQVLAPGSHIYVSERAGDIYSTYRIFKKLGFEISETKYNGWPVTQLVPLENCYEILSNVEKDQKKA